MTKEKQSLRLQLGTAVSSMASIYLLFACDDPMTSQALLPSRTSECAAAYLDQSTDRYPT
jgi:hypothetical protein